MLFLILGLLGTGKTLLATILAKNTDKLKVYANYLIKIPNFEKFDLTLLFSEELKNALIILDEGYVYLESRTSLQMLNKLMSYVLFHSRKIDVDIIITSQLLTTIDVRFRNMSDFNILANKTNNVFRYKVFHQKRFLRTLYVPFSFAERYYNLYDTLEVIKPYRIQESLSKVQSGKEIFNTSRQIAEQLLKDLKNTKIEEITKDRIDLYLLEHNYPQFYAKYVFQFVKEVKKKKKMKK